MQFITMAFNDTRLVWWRAAIKWLMAFEGGAGQISDCPAVTAGWPCSAAARIWSKFLLHAA